MHPEFKDEDEAGERGENMVREMDVNSGEEAVVEMDNNRDTINKREEWDSSMRNTYSSRALENVSPAGLANRNRDPYPLGTPKV